MKHSEKIRRNPHIVDQQKQHEWADEAEKLEKQLASARAIMQRFVDKVDSGLARSTETYAEMKQWMEDE